MSELKKISCVVLHDTSHLKTLSSIFGHVFETEAGVSETASQNLGPHLCAIGAMNDKDLVGGLVAYELPLINGPKEMYLYDIAVLPDFQRQGIGTMLIEGLKAEAKRRGVSTIFVEAEADDVGAVAFYRTLNCEEIAVNHFNISVT